jgi:hypothetical protein
VCGRREGKESEASKSKKQSKKETLKEVGNLCTFVVVHYK